MSEAGHILLVEDEAHIAEGIQFNLEALGHEVELVTDGQQALDRLSRAEGTLDLLILDLMLPQVSGHEVLQRVRAVGNRVPVLIVTAKDHLQDRLRGLEEGADDYLCKPFHLDELLARVQGLLRRRRWDGVAEDASAGAPVRIGVARVDWARFEVETAQGVQALTAREVGLLRALYDADGEVVARGTLLERVWGLDPNTRTRVIDTFISRLRRHLEPDPSRPQHIVSVRGHGYRLLR